MSFLAKGRLYSRNEEHGNAIVTVFLAGSVPSGKNGNGSCCAVVTPTLAAGKGFGQFMSRRRWAARFRDQRSGPGPQHCVE